MLSEAPVADGVTTGTCSDVTLVTMAVTLSVVIPTSDAHRGGYFRDLLVQIGRQDFRDFEVIAVRGDPRQGRAINVGAELARGKYLLTLDDDTALPDPATFSKLVWAGTARSCRTSIQSLVP